jgi:antitoxin VapB
MRTAKIFMNGNSQAVRLPKDFQFDEKEVEILKKGDEVVLRRKKVSLVAAFDLLAEMPDDFFGDEARVDPLPEAREDL